MIKSMWGRKIGMTQLFVENVAVPVTAIDIGSWIISDIKNEHKNGYNAIQIGCLRKRYRSVQFKKEWLKNKKKYFLFAREVYCSEEYVATAAVGTPINIFEDFTQGMKVDVTGWSKGIGFAGVYKRHGFGGAAKTHGSMMGRRPGSIGFTRSSGEIMRGQMMAGHAGCDRVCIKNLEIVTVAPEHNMVMIKGSMPGKSGSLIFIRKKT